MKIFINEDIHYGKPKKWPSLCLELSCLAKFE